MSGETEHDLSRVTRKDRAIYEDAWIADFLRHAPNGTLSTAADGQPFASTLLFVYAPKEHAIYLHTARRGRVWQNLQANPRACFSAAAMGRLLPAETALNFSNEYRSVVAFGTARLVEDPAEAAEALQLLLDKYAPHLLPGRDYRAITPGELEATAVFRLQIEEWSGKQKSAPDDFPGAYVFGSLPVFASARQIQRALQWLTNLLGYHDVPYQIVGGLAAQAYGATRPLVDIDLYLPLDQAQAALAEMRPFLVREPLPHRSDSWDLVYLALEVEGVLIEIGDSSRPARYYNRLDQRWEDQVIDYGASVQAELYGVPVAVMPRAELLRYKAQLDREVDHSDLREMEQPSI